MSKLWLNIPEKYRIELVSFGHTFISFFLAEIIATPTLNFLFQMDLPSVSDLRAIPVAIAGACIRSAWKVFVTKFTSPLFDKNNSEEN